MFKNFWGSQEQQGQPTESWYPPSVVNSPSSSRPTTPGSNNLSRPTDRASSLSNVSPPQHLVRDELRNETLQLARENVDKDPCIMELRNQCRIIRTTELATAQEKLHELERKKEDTLKYYSSSSLLIRLQEAMNKTEEESETLHRQLLDGEIDLPAFVQKYKKMRYTYHKRALIHLAAKTTVTG